MKMPELDDQQRAEIHHALVERRDALMDLVKKSLKIHTPHPTAEKTLLLYGDSTRYNESRARNDTIPGLISLFAPAPADTDEGKKDSAQRDAFDEAHVASAAPTGGGHPANEHAFLDRYGNTHPTAEAAAAANELPDPALERTPVHENDGGIGAEPSEQGTTARLALVAGSPDDEVVADYEIVESGAPLAEIEFYDANGRCKGCKVFRGETHDPACPIGVNERELAEMEAASADAGLSDGAGKTEEGERWDAPQRRAPEPDAAEIPGAPSDELRDKAKRAKVKPGGPIAVDQSVAKSGAGYGDDGL